MSGQVANNLEAASVVDSGKQTRSIVWIVFVLLVLGVLPLVLNSRPFLQEMLAFVFLWGAMAGAWNIVGGYAGKFSLGHAAFFGMGAYTSSILYAKFGITPWIGIFVGIIFSVILALFIGIVTLRLKGKFFALCTIAFVSLMEILAVHFRWLTGGSEGLLVPYEPGLANLTFDSDYEKLIWAYIFAGLLVLVYLVCRWLDKGPLGYRLAALREEEDAAESLGVNTLWAKLASISLSAALTSLGGSLYAQYMLWIEPLYVMSMDLSTQFALFAIIGGMGSAIGPMLGAGLIYPLLSFLRSAFPALPPGFNMLVYGLVLVVVVLFMPRGLVALSEPIKKMWAKIRSSR